MVAPQISAALGTSKNPAYVGRVVSEAITAVKQNDVEYSALLERLREEVASRTVYSYGKKDLEYADTMYAQSPNFFKAHSCAQVPSES